MLSSLTITKHSASSGKSQTITVKIEADATLSALRAVAQEEDIMSARDLFNIGHSGISLPKAREERLTWADIQDPKDKSVHIEVEAKEFSPSEGLTDSEKRYLLEKSRIGFGFDSAGEGGPKYSNRRVVADVPLSLICFAYNDEGQRDIVATESSRKSAYLRAGWADVSLAAKTPWADVGVQASSSHSSETSQFQKRTYVTGRYNFAYATISTKDYVAQLKPHPEFEKTIMDAPAVSNEADRTKEIRDVLKWYGSMFVASVEVGGMKHSTIERILDEKTSETSAKKEMSVELNKQLGSAEVEAKVRVETKTSRPLSRTTNRTRCTSTLLVALSKPQALPSGKRVFPRLAAGA